MRDLTASEVAARTGLTASGVRRLCIAGRVPGAYRPEWPIPHLAPWLIPEEALAAIDARPRPGRPAKSPKESPCAPESSGRSSS